MPFVSRAGQKLDHAIATFNVEVGGATCADLGCSTGGFVDCLLQRGAGKVYAVDTGYGVLDWKLRKDARVVVMERTNAMHVTLPEAVDWVSIDVAWTKQKRILPAAMKILKPTGRVITLIKPHYEADPAQLRGGILPADQVDAVVTGVITQIQSAGFDVISTVTSPILGAKGNTEVLALLQPAEARQLFTSSPQSL
jgi:23S rRNA (cytidine1920-2'-O)/16S rRNA (cytidine1409-2'-O)-methyltransferase